MNTKLQSNYRRYNPNIPKHLVERPHHVIKSCLEKQSLAELIPASSLEILNIEKGIFVVRSENDNTKKYQVHFGSDEAPVLLPSCQCYDWEKHRLPCKHFYTVFRHCPEWPFDRLPASYRESPFITLNKDVSIQSMSQNINTANDEIDADKRNSFDEGIVQEESYHKEAKKLQEIPKPSYRPRNIAAKCRELLGLIKNMTYIAEGWNDAELLSKLKDKLKCVPNAGRDSSQRQLPGTRKSCDCSFSEIIVP